MSRGSLPPVEDDFARALLGSAEADAPSHAAYVKAAAALGIGVGLGAGASLPAAPTAVAVGAAGAAGVARWSSSLGAKLLLFGVSGVSFVAAGALLLRSPEAAKAVSPIGPVLPARAAHATVEPSPAAPATPNAADERSVARLVPAPVPRPVAGAAAAKPAEQASPSGAFRPLAATPAAATPFARRISHALPTRVSSGSSLAEQVQSLDRARVALAAGDSSAALREIARYRAAWPNGVFLTEASVLEIEALAARGERSLAQERAAEFVEAHPDSPQADRLRALIPNKNR